MSIGAIGGTAEISAPASTSTQLASQNTLAGNPYLITARTSQTNADGTIAVVTTYANGSSTTTTEANPHPVANTGTASHNISASDPRLVTGRTSRTNVDGTITIVTTYANGDISSATEANPHLAGTHGLLSESNSRQSEALLNAQESSQQNAASTTHTAAHPSHEQLGHLVSAQG